MPVSLNPNTFIEGGLIDDVDVTWKEIAFCQWDYNGSIPEPVLALGIKMEYPDPDKPGQFKEVEQYYSAGDLQYFVPSPDGSSVEPVGSKTALNTNTNAAKLLMSLQVAGAGTLDEILNSGSVAGLAGINVHMNRTAQPKRSGIVRTGKNADRESTVFLVTKVNHLPGQAAPAAQKKGLGKSTAPPAAAPAAARTGLGGNKGMATAATAPAAPAAQAPAQAPTNGAAIDELTAQVLVELLMANDGTLAKKDLPPKAFTSPTLKGNPLKTKVVQRIFEDAFLSTVDGITFDGATITMQG